MRPHPAEPKNQITIFKTIPKICLLFLLVHLVNVSAVKALEPQVKGEQKELQHEVAVTLKLIQVHVTDTQGNPVANLKKEDFILWDNGKLQNITDFETHFTRAPAERPPEKEVSSPSPARMNRKFFLFLDIQRNDPIGMIKSKRVARYFVETQIQPGDEVGVFSFQPSAGFVLHEYLTQDLEKMLSAIKKAKALPVYSSPEGVPGGGAGQSSGSSSGETAGEGEATHAGSRNLDAGLPTVDEGASWSQLAKPLYMFFYSLEDLSQSLQYVPGIKNIVLFSAGTSAGAKNTFDLLGQKLASSSCRVYTVDTNWRLHYLKGYFESGPGSALRQLAVSSGGKHFEDPDDIETIAQDIQRMTGNFYVLGYYIQPEWDGQYHEIKVKVKKKDCVIYAQKGYFNPKPFSTFSDAEKQLHLADIAWNDTPYFETPKPFPLEALPFPGNEAAKLVLLSEIRPENLVDVFLNDTEIITVVLDEEKNIVESGRAVLKYDSIKQTPIHHYSITRLAPGLYECRVVVRNLESGKSALGSASVRVPEFRESGLNLYPLFLLIPEKGSFYLRAVKEEKAKEREALSLRDLYPYLSSIHSPLVKEVDRSVRNLLAVLRFSTRLTEEHPLDLDVDLIHSQSGQKIPLEFIIKESGMFGLNEAMLLEIWLPSLEPEIYTLHVILSDPESNQKAEVSRAFRIR